jgi:hypothetical protein
VGQQQALQQHLAVVVQDRQQQLIEMVQELRLQHQQQHRQLLLVLVRSSWGHSSHLQHRQVVQQPEQQALASTQL